MMHRQGWKAGSLEHQERELCECTVNADCISKPQAVQELFILSQNLSYKVALFSSERFLDPTNFTDSIASFVSHMFSFFFLSFNCFILLWNCWIFLKCLGIHSDNINFIFNLFYVKVYFYRVDVISVFPWPSLKVSHKLHNFAVYLLVKEPSTIICCQLDSTWLLGVWDEAAWVHLGEVRDTRWMFYTAIQSYCQHTIPAQLTGFGPLKALCTSL